jgi:SAM-dependent methyltransferase
MLKQLAKRAAQLAQIEIRRLHEGDEDREVYLALYPKESVENRRFYNVSAGGHFGFGCGLKHPLWTSIDVDRPWKGERVFNPRLDIAHDLLTMTPIPVESGTAELVHSRITIEHLPDEAVAYFFKEVKRMLKPGGIFRVVAPNIDLDYRALRANDRYYFNWEAPSVSLEQAMLVHFASHTSTLFQGPSRERISDQEFREIFETKTKEEALNYCTSKCNMDLQRSYRSHINWWNEAKLRSALVTAGFSEVSLSGAGQSASPVLRNTYHFDNKYAVYMLFMECVA